MNPKRRDSNCERRSPDVYSTSSAASSTKNTNSHRGQVQRPGRMNLQDCLREMNSVMRVLDNSRLDAHNRVEELNSILDGDPMGLSLSTQSLASSSSALSPEVEILLRNQQSILKQLADSRTQMSALEQQQQSAAVSNARYSAKLASASSRELNASLRVSHDANALVERLKTQVERAAEECRRAQDALEGARVSHREMTPYEMEEDVFERGDPEGDAPVSDDNKMTIQSNPRFVRRMIPNGGPLSAPYTTSEGSTFDFPETPEQSDIEEKVRTLAETKHQIDALRGMITQLEGRGGPTPSKGTPRPVPIYPPVTPVTPFQQKRRQRLREINRSLHEIETLMQREVVGQKRNLSVTENPLRSGARPRFNSCNVQPWDNYPLFEALFRGSQPRSLTEAATCGGSSTQENSDNGEVQSDCTDSEIERIAAFNPVLTGARPKVREEPAGAVSHVASSCDSCAHLAAYTQMLTLSLVQANEVITGQQKEIEKLKALLRPPAAESAPPAPGVRPLNNQVTPGVRANNYVDNLKSFSTLNLLSQPVERRVPPAPQTGERNDLGRGDEERQRRKPNKNSMNSMNQINFCRYSSNPELNREEENKVPLPQLCRERLEMQPALDAATAFLTSKEGELCTPDILIQTCRCLLDQLTPAGVSHKHILRVLQPTLGQFLARPVNPAHIMENLTSVLQKELAVLTKGHSSPSERTFVLSSGAAVSGISDRSTAGNDQPEDADGASGGDAEGGEDVAEADQGTDDKEGAVGGRAAPAEYASSREVSAQASPDSDIVTSSTHERFAPEEDN